MPSLQHVQGLLGSAAGPGCAALERAALVFAQAAPNSGVLAGLDGPLQAGVYHLAAAADALRFLNLKQGGPCIADREEQLRVFV